MSPPTFLTLPLELRQEIYSHLLPSVSQPVRLAKNGIPLHPLLHINTQIRNETFLLVCKHHKISYPHRSPKRKSMHRFLQLYDEYSPPLSAWPRRNGLRFLVRARGDEVAGWIKWSLKEGVGISFVPVIEDDLREWSDGAIGSMLPRWLWIVLGGFGWAFAWGGFGRGI